MNTHFDRVKKAQSSVKLGLSEFHKEKRLSLKGKVFFEMKDISTGKCKGFSSRNLITLDAGILAARLFRNSLDPSSSQNNGITMLAVGTGATGNLLSPDAPQNTQRKLNSEIARKSFSSTVFRNSSGVAVNFPTNVVDFTTTFGESEAVGPLNEMGLLSTVSLNPTVNNSIDNGPTDYDATIDVTGKDILINYLPFSVVTKPATAVLSITWRLTF